MADKLTPKERSVRHRSRYCLVCGVAVAIGERCDCDMLPDSAYDHRELRAPEYHGEMIASGHR